MRKGFIFFLLSWVPLMAALPTGNARWADMEDWIDEGENLSGLTIEESRYLKMGAAYEVIFGTTDQTHSVDMLEATIFLLKKARKARSWSLAPSFPKKFRKQGKKDSEKVMSHPFFANLLYANQTLAKALTLDDPAQRLQQLQLIYPHQADHWPTLMALCETYWALGRMEEGDAFLERAWDQEPLPALWPSLVALAKYLRRTDSHERAIELLRRAEKFTFNKQNPAKRLIRKWEAETLAAKGDASKLAELRAWDELFKLANQGDTLAMRYAAPQTLKDGKFIKTKKWLKKRIKKEPNDGEAMWLLLNKGHGFSVTDGTFLFKRAKKLQGKPRDVAKALLVRSFEPGLSHAEVAALREEAVKADPSFRKAWVYWIDRLRTMEDHEAYDAAEARFWKAFPSAETLAELIARRNNYGDLAAYLTLLQRAEQDYLGNEQVAQALVRGGNKLKGTDSFERLQYFVLDAALTSVGQLRYLEAAKMLKDLYVVDETNREINLLMANCYYQGGAYEKAMPCFKQAKEDFPESAVVQELYGDLCFINNFLFRAIRNFRKAKKAGSNPTRIQAKLDEMDEIMMYKGIDLSNTEGTALSELQATPYSYEGFTNSMRGIRTIGPRRRMKPNMIIREIIRESQFLSSFRPSAGVTGDTKWFSRRQRPTACYSFRGEPTGPLTFWTMTHSDTPTALQETGPLLESLRAQYRQWQSQYGNSGAKL